jgi:hypothetical protein
MNKFEEIDRERKESNARFEKLNSKVYKLFLEMGDATFCDGATIHEVLEALEVAIDMGVGPVTVNSRFALDVMENTFGKIK